MVKTYWSLFYLSLAGIIVFVSLFVLGFVFMKRVSGKKYGGLLLIVCSCITVSLVAISAVNFAQCLKDYHYISDNTFVEEKAVVVEFTVSRIDYDGNGQQVNSNPKFYLIEKDQYIILHVKNVEIGETYVIRYYPNTQICEVVEKVSK